MKKKILLLFTLVLLLSACTVNPPTELTSNVEQINQEVTDKDTFYEYKQKGVDYQYLETYDPEEDIFNVVYTKEGESGEYKLDYTTDSNNNITLNSQSLADKDLGTSLTKELSSQVKNYDELTELHTSFLSTYEENVASDNNFKNLTETDDNYVLDGKTEGDADVKITVAKDASFIEVYDNNNEYRQSITII